MEDTFNRIYTSNNLNQYTAIIGNGVVTSQTYDRNGNAFSDAKNTYTYDYENRLIQIQNNISTVSYKYDALGRRISKAIDSVETNYFYDGYNLIEETEYNTFKNYVYSNRVDQIIFSKNKLSSFYYHIDHLNSVQSLTDEEGNVLEQYNYDVFGYPHVFNASSIKLNKSEINNIFFTGRSFDFQFDIYDYRERELNPFIGRFLQRDRLDFLDGFNLYTYVGNNSLNRVDPLGAQAVLAPVCAAVVFIAGYWAIKEIKIDWKIDDGMVYLIQIIKEEKEDIYVLYKEICKVCVEFSRNTQKKSRIRTASYPYKINPGRDKKGKCNDCPVPAGVPFHPDHHTKPGDGCPGEHWHYDIYNQNPQTCLCILAPHSLAVCGPPPNIGQ